MARSRTFVFVTLLLALAGACRNPSGPHVDPADAIAFRPVSDITIDKVLTPTMVVTYPEPIADGGVPPLTVKCTPPSGFAFSPGVTVVTCTASDGVRTGETHFNVTIVPVTPVISQTKFLAFGDSITAGAVETNPAPSIFAEVDQSKSYPTVLRGLLSARYSAQTIGMINSGTQLEFATEGVGRLKSELDFYQPKVLLLLEGVNDLGQEVGGGFSAIPGMISALRQDLLNARRARVEASFLATLTPMKHQLFGYPHNDMALPYIEAANNEIRALAAEQGATLVDTYAAMIGDVDTLIGGDGLHPTEKGFVVLAQTFMKAIQAKLELPLGSPVPTSASFLFQKPR